MGDLPSIVQERIHSLTARFHADLGKRAERLDTCRYNALNGDAAALRSLRLQIHRLGGTALTFGYRRLHETAKTSESAIEVDLSNRRGLGSEADSKVTRLIEIMRETNVGESGLQSRSAPRGEQKGETDSVTGDNADSDAFDHPRIVIVVGSIEGLPSDISEQLSVFGMVAVSVTEPQGIRDFLNRVNLGTDVQKCVVLAGVSFLAEQRSRLRTLKTIRDEHPGHILTVLVGSADDFQSRLRSVRYGADAFVPLPLDTTILIDKLNAVSKQDEADPYHILIVDDDPDQVSDTALALQNAGMITSVVTDPQQIFRVLVEYEPELILMDMYMPQCTGVELAMIIRQSESFVGIPIVFLSVENDRDEQLSAIRTGADDYIVKPFDVEHLVTSVRIRAGRTRAMRFYMERDSLTGLLNHTNLKQRLEHELQRSRRIGINLVFAMIDIDKFKGVNDAYGHLTGDRVLKSLARLLTERLRRTDIIGRYGGEEFGVILFNTTIVHAERIMNEIRESFAMIRQTSGTVEFSVTFSCGLAEFPTYETGQSINEAADNALYRAKETGRNRVIVAD